MALYYRPAWGDLAFEDGRLVIDEAYWKAEVTHEEALIQVSVIGLCVRSRILHNYMICYGPILFKYLFLASYKICK